MFGIVPVLVVPPDEAGAPDPPALGAPDVPLDAAGVELHAPAISATEIRPAAVRGPHLR